MLRKLILLSALFLIAYSPVASAYIERGVIDRDTGHVIISSRVKNVYKFEYFLFSKKGFLGSPYSSRYYITILGKSMTFDHIDKVEVKFNATTFPHGLFNYVYVPDDSDDNAVKNGLDTRTSIIHSYEPNSIKQKVNTDENGLHKILAEIEVGGDLAGMLQYAYNVDVVFYFNDGTTAAITPINSLIEEWNKVAQTDF